MTYNEIKGFQFEQRKNITTADDGSKVFTGNADEIDIMKYVANCLVDPEDGKPLFLPDNEDEVNLLRAAVTHNFALLPGPGRFLSKFLVRADGRPDRISPRIDRQTARNRERIYTTPIWASVTMTNEGMKSVMPYVQETE